MSNNHAERFKRFLENVSGERGDLKYERAISEMAVKGLRSLVVDFQDIYLFDESLALELICEPRTCLPMFDSAATSKLRIRDRDYADQIQEIHIRLKSLPKETPLRDIVSDKIGDLVITSGIILRASTVMARFTETVFRCKGCGEPTHVKQTGQFLLYPERCPACERRRGFEIDIYASSYVDYQRLRVQECPEDLPPGQMPQSIYVELLDDLVNIARPGDRVRVTGVVGVHLLKQKDHRREVTTYLLGNYIDIGSRELELEITPEDEARIRELASDPWIHRMVLHSIAPSIYGYEAIKEAIMYLLFGGVPKELPDIRIRGDISVLLVGDPGTAKSQLLQYAAKIAPRGLYTAGRGSTAAGLTAAVVKEQPDGIFTLEAGALVLADKGVCCIDEMDKMRADDRSAIHPAMEQQVVSIAKGGIVATLNARTSILAAANPTLGRYDSHQTVVANINLPVTLLSRFDLIFVIRDEPQKDRNSKMAEHILKLHEMERPPSDPPIKPQLLRKYITHSKRLRPKITPEAHKALSEFYMKMRAASRNSSEGAIAITPRQLESLVRLAEARARVHLREEVTVEDAEAVIALMQRSLEQVGIDVTTGEIDIDLIMTGKPRSLQIQLQKVLNVITEMERITGVVRDDDLFSALLQDHQINRVDAAKLIGILARDGTIYSPRPSYYKRTR